MSVISGDYAVGMNLGLDIVLSGHRSEELVVVRAQ